MKYILVLCLLIHFATFGQVASTENVINSKLIATLNNRGCSNCIIELTKKDVKEVRIGVRFENYNEKKFTTFYVKQYTLLFPEGYIYKAYDNKFSDTAQNMILQYPIGTIFKIIDIEYNIDSYGPPKAELKFMLVEK